MRFRILLCLSFLSFHNIFSQCDHPDFESLMQFYNATNGENWDYNFGWRDGKTGNSCDPCSYLGKPWFGVICENERVIGITSQVETDLDNNVTIL